MSLTTQRLSTSELTGRILEMARTGVYRESIFEVFRPVATKRQIRSAIAQAKQFGLHSVASLRDGDLGTYYQIEHSKYQVFQEALRTSSSLAAGEDLGQQIISTTRAIKAMLVVAGGSALSLFVVGSACLLSGHSQSGGTLWLGSVLAGGLWMVQRSIARKTL
ncbi:MAG TPA: hypothetical protein V6D07_09010 [Trichocoleus sp.]